ncbi:hypothetical protein [Carboxylicivirga sp. 1411-1]
MHLKFTIALLFSIFSLLAQDRLDAEQAAWLYRIVQKTPVLKQNWQHYFEFDTRPFHRVSTMNPGLDYDAIGRYQIYHPQSLLIHYDSIQGSSNGLISEAAIKITLWELNEELKKHIYQRANANDSLIQTLQDPIITRLPRRMSSKKREKTLTSVTHPSLPIFKKIEQLEKLKIDAETQKLLLNTWSDIISDYCFQRSQYFFRILSGGLELESTTFLAAGEGSGTAGLLNEWEPHPKDSTQRWYSKGIGLFTYTTRVHDEQLQLQTHLKKELCLPGSASTVLHTSLWGLDSSFKPMLIIIDDTLSYHLFADYSTMSLTPDGHSGKGISHIDRIEQYRQIHIIDALQKINDHSPLTKAIDSKTQTEKEIAVLENEIDSLLKLTPGNQNAINHRKRLIDAKLTTLSSKTRRVNSLEREAEATYRKITKAENKLQSMVNLLGPNPQAWRQEGNTYHFPSGVSFNEQTGDLIFPRRADSRQLSIRLLSAGYTLSGHRKDEVQAYVSISKAKEHPHWAEKTTVDTSIDTLLYFYFHPDKYESHTRINLPQQLRKQAKKFKHLQINLAAINQEERAHNHRHQYSNRAREYEKPLTAYARQRAAHAHLCTNDSTLIITIKAGADPVPSRLSQVPDIPGKKINKPGYHPYNNNLLKTLRALSTLNKVCQYLRKNVPDLKEINSQLNISHDEMERLYPAIIKKPDPDA